MKNLATKNITSKLQKITMIIFVLAMLFALSSPITANAAINALEYVPGKTEISTAPSADIPPEIAFLTTTGDEEIVTGDGDINKITNWIDDLGGYLEKIGRAILVLCFFGVSIMMMTGGAQGLSKSKGWIIAIVAGGALMMFAGTIINLLFT